MDEKPSEIALVPAQADLQVALRGAVSLWASATTSESERRNDLLRDKRRIVLSFFLHTGKLPSEVEPAEGAADEGGAARLPHERGKGTNVTMSPDKESR